MIRNILDKNGNIIGELELPDETSEAEWEFQLGSYICEDIVPPKILPDVTPRQIRQALTLTGITEQQIDEAINSFPEPIKTMATIEWQYSTMFQRTRPLVLEVQQILEWTDEQVDALWKLAASL